MSRKRGSAIARLAESRLEGLLSGGLPFSPWWLVGGAAVAFLLANRKGVEAVASSLKTGINSVLSAGQQAAFAAALPANIGRYAGQLVAAGARYRVSPWVLAAIMKRESNGGDALTPIGPGGTGDFSPRKAGTTYAQPDGSKYAVGPSGLPEDGRGWGRGLMQIDFGVHHAWALSASWADAQTNIDKAAELFAANLRFFLSSPSSGVMVDCWRLSAGLPSANVAAWRTKYPKATLPVCSAGAKQVGPFRDPRPLAGQQLYEAALAAYNAGPSGVLQALAVGLPAEAVTAGQDYVSWMLGRVAPWMAAFSA